MRAVTQVQGGDVNFGLVSEGRGTEKVSSTYLGSPRRDRSRSLDVKTRQADAAGAGGLLTVDTSGLNSLLASMSDFVDLSRDNLRSPDTFISRASPRDRVKELPSYLEGGVLSLLLRGLEAKLEEFKVDKGEWSGILFMNLPAKTKESIVELVQARVPYSDLKQALVKRSGRGLAEIGVELFPPQRKVRSDVVGYIKGCVAMVERLKMLCNGDVDQLALFVATGSLYADLPVNQATAIKNQQCESLQEVVQAGLVLK